MEFWAALDHGDARRAEEIIAMLQRTGLCLLLGVIGAAPACGSPSDNDFSGPALGGSRTMGGAGGSAGSTATGGTSGDSGTAGQGGSSSGAGGFATGGSDVGGTGTGGSATEGGSSGDAAMGGTGMAAGSVDPGTGGEDPGSGGAEPVTGGTGGMPAAGMGGKGGGKGGRGGAGGQTNCGELAQQYAGALAAARACNAKSGKEQCTELATSSLTCGCDVPVNPDKTEAIAELTRLRKAGAGCSMACPAIACLPPEGAECAPDVESPGLCRSVGAVLE